ncbi:MAG: hypothetical protein LBE85_04365, partial [Candidatus Accumulibacter sp.]|nr:hypothetical protein [Accumulibacter sp.]
MSSVFFDPEVGGDGSTVSDDADPATGLRNYGWTTRFVPALSQLVAVAAWIKEWVTARRDEIGAADSSATSAAATATLAAATASNAATSASGSASMASSAADTATQMRDQAAAIRDEAQTIVTGDVINDGDISLASTWSSSGIADKMHLAASAVYQHDSAGRIMSVLEALPGGT